jgi:hypothetical protein
LLCPFKMANPRQAVNSANTIRDLVISTLSSKNDRLRATLKPPEKRRRFERE